MNKRKLTLALLMPSLVAVSATHASDNTFEGIYQSGFEVSEFRPCGKPEQWWLSSTQGSFDEIREYFESLESMDGQGLLDRRPELYLEVEAAVSPPGQYGHLGVFVRRIDVTKVLKWRVATDEDFARCSD